MKAFSTVWPAALLAGAASLGLVDRASNAAPAKAAASRLPQYRAAVLRPQNGYYVAGAVAMTRYGSKSYSVSIVLQGLSEFRPYKVRVVYEPCGSNPASGTEVATLQANDLGNGMSLNHIVSAAALSSVVGLAVYKPGESKGASGRSHPGAAQACGELYQPTRVVHLHPTGHVYTHAAGVALLKEPAIVSGSRVKRGTDVVISMAGLERSAVQASDIALGRCADKGRRRLSTAAPDL